jgi:hypothetical protein
MELLWSRFCPIPTLALVEGEGEFLQLKIETNQDLKWLPPYPLDIMSAR